jgi:acyl-CoA thioester hydrolase
MTQSDSTEKKFTINLFVPKNDIDEMGHVNNVVYVRWVQEVAAAHWASRAPLQLREKYMWVVFRHEIDYINPAFEGDQLTVATWVEDSKGPRFERYSEIINEKTGKILAKAKTTWCMLDSATMKPKRMDEEMVALLRG